MFPNLSWHTVKLRRENIIIPLIATYGATGHFSVVLAFLKVCAIPWWISPRSSIRDTHDIHLWCKSLCLELYTTEYFILYDFLDPHTETITWGPIQLVNRTSSGCFEKYYLNLFESSVSFVVMDFEHKRSRGYMRISSKLVEVGSFCPRCRDSRSLWICDGIIWSFT